MKATAESTKQVVEVVVNGTQVPARVWKARSERGVEFLMFVTRVAVPTGADSSQFDRELIEQPHTSLEGTAGLPQGPIDLRLII
jgi:hypothetical protein